MLVQEVPQRRDEMPGLRNIMPPNSHSDLVHQDVSDLLGSVHGLEQRCAEHNRKRISDVLVLGNGVDLIRREIAEADQIDERDYASLLWTWLTGRFCLRPNDHSRHGVTVRSEQRPM